MMPHLSHCYSMALWLEASGGIKRGKILVMGSLGRTYTPGLSSSTAIASRKEIQLDKEVHNLKTQLAMKDEEIKAQLAKNDEEIKEFRQSHEITQQLILQHLKLDASQFLPS